MKEKPMLSTPLYHKDNKGSHYTVGKVRSNISSKLMTKRSQEQSPRLRVFSTRLQRRRLSQKQACSSLITFWRDIRDPEVQKQFKTANSKWKSEFISNSIAVLVMQTALGRRPWSRVRVPYSAKGNLQPCLQHPHWVQCQKATQPVMEASKANGRQLFLLPIPIMSPLQV